MTGKPDESVPVFVGGTGAPGTSGASSATFCRFLSSHSMYSRGQLSRVQRLGVVTRFRRHVSDHGCLTRQRAQTLFQQVSHFAFFARQMSLAVEYAQNNVAKTRKSNGASRSFSSVTVSEIDEVKPRPTSDDSTNSRILGAVDRILVHVQRKDEVRVAAVKIVGHVGRPRGQGRVQQVSGLLGSRTSKLGLIG